MSAGSKIAIASLPGAGELAASLANHLGLGRVELEHRRFPDGESYLRFHDTVDGADLLLVARLDRPDERVPALLFAADLARDLGAARVGLVCPYLPYMRQDQRFKPGEALTSRTFACWLSAHFDWLVTVDPHLHRYAGLDEIYSIPSQVVGAAPALADWIADQVPDPVLIGPDGESEQWVSAVAGHRDLPWRVFSKVRRGDRDVSLTDPDLSGLSHRTPVLVDDIISSGTTLIEAASRIVEAGLRRPVAVGVHGLFADEARTALAAAEIERVVCTNTVAAPEAAIDIAPLLGGAIKDDFIRR
ncbi:ribose-phosphate diphosphokinase [Wenzhouxiangella sp. XN201]|uniref:ribose-phosphate diphosphokinase n=1 Tax=Wenzhouxiangella sp. XN201 TaxID=2710755 RepID=UPI0013CDA2F0|nr:ribose-phosphate diphosphokinase [Wenzhouxiangella sp. XN201]NEZ04360.1 ribose-phosphate diphosphokinase [Wenzhouxiangella sp. XN201]